MKITYDNPDIPEWLKPHMKMFCECGGVIADDGPVDYKGRMKLTQRWCMNPNCPYHMAKRIQMLAERMGVVGVGIKTAQDMAIGYRFTNHLQALRFWFPVKPSVYLYEVAEMSYIYGVSSEWKDLLAGYTSFVEFYAENPWPALDAAIQYKSYLLECEKYFDVKQERITNRVLYVMLTGSIHGFNSRREFLDAINERYKGIFRVEDNKKTVRGTYCLVKEPGSVDYSKTQIAMANNIPIMDSAHFVALLERLKGEFVNETG